MGEVLQTRKSEANFSDNYHPGGVLLGNTQLVEEEVQQSLQFTRQIQLGVTNNNHLFSSLFTDSFLVDKPRDIVSGDFVWSSSHFHRHKIFVLGDCMGHGMPAALTSVMTTLLLSEIVTSLRQPNPAEILKQLHNRLCHLGLKDNVLGTPLAGVDLGICVVNKGKRTLSFAGANRSLFIVDGGGELKELKGNKLMIGDSAYGDIEKGFSSFNYDEGDMIYMSSDGFYDQFGGPNNKKFMKRNFKELLQNIAHLSSERQQMELSIVFDNWKFINQQTDDVLVAGVRL